MQITLLKEELPEFLIKEYERILGCREGEISKLPIKLVRVWNGTGSINIHTYTILEDKTEITSLVDMCYKIFNLVISHIDIPDHIWSSWKFKNNELIENEPTSVKIMMMISLAILIYNESAMFEVGRMLPAIKQEVTKDRVIS